MKNKNIYTLIIFICIVLASSIFIIYRKQSDKTSEDKTIVSEIKFDNIGTYKVKLDNRNVDVVISGENPYREVTIDNKKVDHYLDYLGKLNIIDDEIIISQTNGIYDDIYYYDKEMKSIKPNFQFEKDYNMNIVKIEEIKENKLIVFAMNEMVLNNYVNGKDYITLCRNINIDEYKKQYSEAKYEIKYLGKGKFSKPKQIGEEKYVIDDCNKLLENSKETKHIDLEVIRQSLKNQIQNNNKNAYIVKCKDIIKNGEPSMDETFIKVSNSTIDTIIEKLKTAETYEEFIGGYESCPPKNIMYYVGGEKYNNDKQFLLEYSDNENVLLIGYFVDDGNIGGYKFIFNNNDDIKDFIEDLEIIEE